MTKKKILFVTTLVIGLVFLTGCGNAKLKNGKEVVFTVNGDKVTADSFYKDLRDKYAKTLMIDIIDKKILDDLYKGDSDIETQANNAVESLKAQYSDNWEETLENAGYDSEEDLKDYYKLSFQRSKAIDDKIKEDISNKNIREYYNNESVGDIRCKHILIGVSTSTSSSEENTGLSDEDAKKKAEEIIKKLDAGEDFDKLAKENSTDTGSASKGGDLGYFNKGDMVQEFETAAYNLKVKEYTKEPVKTSYGYHIILKTDEKEKPKLNKLKKTIIEKLVEQKKEDDPTLEVTVMDKLRKEYKLNFKDAKLKKLYKKYIEAAKKSAEKAAEESSSNAS